MQFKKILCPVDFSEVSRSSLSQAVDLAKQFGAGLVVAHVVSKAPWLVAPTPTMPVSMEVIQDDLRKWSRDKLDEMVARLAVDGLEIETVLETGDPGKVISKIAAEEKIDLIVMASREDTALERFLFGSVAEKVIRSSPCPVLILKK